MNDQNWININDHLFNLDEIVEFYKSDSYELSTICVRFKNKDDVTLIAYQSETKRNKGFSEIETLILRTKYAVKRVDDFVAGRTPEVPVPAVR